MVWKMLFFKPNKKGKWKITKDNNTDTSTGRLHSLELNRKKRQVLNQNDKVIVLLFYYFILILHIYTILLNLINI